MVWAITGALPMPLLLPLRPDPDLQCSVLLSRCIPLILRLSWFNSSTKRLNHWNSLAGFLLLGYDQGVMSGIVRPPP
jgi:hypothetical protein